LRDAYPAVLERHRTILARSAEMHGGARFSTEGDACCFSFDAASGAVAAAVEGQRALAAAGFGPS
jgi:class 3 adenylate cyclase